MKPIETLLINEILDLILDEVAKEYGRNETCTYDGTRKDTESKQEYKDRIYTDAFEAVTDAIIRIEEGGEYDCCIDDADGAEWYDEVRDDAINEVMDWFFNA